MSLKVLLDLCDGPQEPKEGFLNQKRNFLVPKGLSLNFFGVSFFLLRFFDAVLGNLPWYLKNLLKNFWLSLERCSILF
jgi:hypothetical protein